MSWTNKSWGDERGKCILRDIEAFGYARGKGMGSNQPAFVDIE